MAIKTENRHYTTLLEYLKRERSEYYKEFKKGYLGQKTALPELTEQQYLILILQHAGKRPRTILESLDGSLTDNGEITKLEKIIEKSKRIMGLIRSYREVRNSPYVTRQDKEKLDKQVAKQVYESMDGKDKKEYNIRRLIVIIPKLNIGPWKQGSNGDLGSNGDQDEFLIRNRAIFEENPELPERILERFYQQRLNSARNVSEARKILRRLTS